ncbi:cysteine hydrolase family protein [Scopulibacillus cellulosilyticus]|uniref:Cysteine hydrolase family protein n=1 Tax=Scopulibacillus cellulosilyticus TaxID=2665665 RepID=A0ABW2PS87_9BACL
MQKLPENTALIIIDVQKGFNDPSWGKRNNPDAEVKIERILNNFREKNRPVIHIQHLSQKADSPLRSGSPGSEFKDNVKPLMGEPIFQKRVNSAFIGTNLEQYLKENEYHTVVIVGLTTDHCVSTTTRMASNLGFNVYLISDATATFDKVGFDGTHYAAEELHKVNLASLHNEFATVMDTETLLKHL